MTGAERIARERERQIAKEGWSAEHDDEHSRGELSLAAACYAAPPETHLRGLVHVQDPDNPLGRYVSRDPWPWDSIWDKRPAPGCTRDARIRSLAKAGALIAAEIDRLERRGEP